MTKMLLLGVAFGLGCALAFRFWLQILVGLAVTAASAAIAFLYWIAWTRLDMHPSAKGALLGFLTWQGAYLIWRELRDSPEEPKAAVDNEEEIE